MLGLRQPLALQAIQFRGRRLVHAFCRVHDERDVQWRLATSCTHVAAGFAIRADGLALERERVRPSEGLHQADGNVTALAVERVVMRDRRRP